MKIMVKNLLTSMGFELYKIKNISDRLNMLKSLIPARNSDMMRFEKLSISQMELIMNSISDYKEKIFLVGLYEIQKKTGLYQIKNKSSLVELKNLLRKNNLFSKLFIEKLSQVSFRAADIQNYTQKKIHYGCGNNLLEDGWLNVDFYQSNQGDYLRINLVELQPFQDNSFEFAFAEDFLEHLSQSDSIIFLSEAFRALKANGVLRLSFPGLEGVLLKHYPNLPLSYFDGKVEAYLYWDHIHFYSKEELSLVAKHIGFSKIHFVDFGKSKYSELCNLDTRSDQIGLNTYVELTK